MTDTIIRIRKPRDPLADMLGRNRASYRRKWLLPVSDTRQAEDRAVAPAMAERTLSDKVIDAFRQSGVKGV